MGEGPLREKLRKTSEDKPQVYSVKKTCGRELEDMQKVAWSVPLQWSMYNYKSNMSQINQWNTMAWLSWDNKKIVHAYCAYICDHNKRPKEKREEKKHIPQDNETNYNRSIELDLEKNWLEKEIRDIL